MDKTTKKWIKEMEKQSAEFDAVTELAKALNNLPAVVDDDYPEMRHFYENALQKLINRLKSNGRI